MFAYLRLDVKYNSNSLFGHTNSTNSVNFEFSFWIWHFSYSDSLEMALKIKVLSPQVFMNLREKIQKSRLKKSTWIFEEYVSVHVF